MAISCIIPTCNRNKFLIEAIDSVLKQTFLPEEIIVVNNGEKEIALPVGMITRIVIYNTKPSIGASAARNYGAKLAKGDYLAFLDDDDLWSEKYLENVAEEIKKGELCIISRLDKIENGQTSHYKNAENKLIVKNLLTFNPGVNGSNIVIARSTFWQVGGFDDKLPTSEDKSLIIELINAGIDIKILPDNKVLYRIDSSPKKLTGTKSMAEGIYQFTKKYKKLMTLNQYFYNWYKIYFYRYKAGRKSALFPYFFLALFFAPKSIFKFLIK